jgi:hypothetical protein
MKLKVEGKESALQVGVYWYCGYYREYWFEEWTRIDSSVSQSREECEQLTREFSPKKFYLK